MDYRIPRPVCLWSYADMLIQLARCKLYTVGPIRTAMSAILYWKKKSGRREAAFTQGYKNKPSEPVQNRFKIRMVRKSEPETGQVRKRTIPFPYEQKRQVQFRSTFRTFWVSTGTRKCFALILSQYIRETLFSCRCIHVFIFGRIKKLQISFLGCLKKP